MTGLDFVCVIHGQLYPWVYVEHLYSMLQRHLKTNFRFHIFTESHREVPAYMIKHELTDWPGIHGPKSAWWYKMQIFDPLRGLGKVLYLDLDTVIVNDLSWIMDLDPTKFWSIRDFKHLWRPDWQNMNSSLMFFDSAKFAYIWRNFQTQTVHTISKQFRGDQDYLSHVVDRQHLQFVPMMRAVSWRWQIYQGGLDISKRHYRHPNQPTVIPADTSLIIFHGTPKPHDIEDPVILSHWL